MSEMRLVLIEWEDSFGCSPGWSPLDDLKPESLTCKSVGWLAFDGDKVKVLVPNVSDKQASCNQQGCGDIAIPARAITKITDLIVVGEEPEA